MSINLDSAWLVAAFLVSLRLGVLFVIAPGFGTVLLPGPFRALVVLALASALVGAMGLATGRLPDSVLGLISAGLNELVVGGMLAFGLFAAFGAFTVAGRAMDLQIGFGAANLIDPVSRTQAPLLGTILNLLALVVFFAIDGHHLLLRGLAASFERIPPGTGLTEIVPRALALQFGISFSAGLALAAPVMAFLLLIDLGLAVMSRTMPQFNVFFVSLPLKIFAGLSLLALSLAYAGPLMNRIFGSIFSFWEGVLY
jgi:flagellar biosynthetic protein FliR